MLVFDLNPVARHVLVFQKARDWLLPRRYLQVDSSGVRVSRDFDAGAWVRTCWRRLSQVVGIKKQSTIVNASPGTMRWWSLLGWPVADILSKHDPDIEIVDLHLLVLNRQFATFQAQTSQWLIIVYAIHPHVALKSFTSALLNLFKKAKCGK